MNWQVVMMILAIVAVFIPFLIVDGFDGHKRDKEDEHGDC